MGQSSIHRPQKEQDQLSIRYWLFCNVILPSGQISLQTSQLIQRVFTSKDKFMYSYLNTYLELELKFLKRPVVIKNALLFCLLSLFFLSVVESLEGGVSALDLKGFASRIRGDILLIAGTTLVFLSVFRGSRFSPHIFLVFCGYILVRSFNIFFIDLDKVILFLIFLYSVIAYNFFLFLKMELQEPFYNPRFPSNILPEFGYRKLPVILKQGPKTLEAHLTNWGINGFFCHVEDDEKLLRGNLEVEIHLEGHTFYAEGVVMTRFKNGVGVRVIKNPVPDLGWNDYYGIINELGFRPTYN